MSSTCINYLVINSVDFFQISVCPYYTQRKLLVFVCFHWFHNPVVATVSVPQREDGVRSKKEFASLAVLAV
jgi:hypothetical protein